MAMVMVTKNYLIVAVGLVYHKINNIKNLLLIIDDLTIESSTFMMVLTIGIVIVKVIIMIVVYCPSLSTSLTNH